MKRVLVLLLLAGCPEKDTQDTEDTEDTEVVDTDDTQEPCDLFYSLVVGGNTDATAPAGSQVEFTATIRNAGFETVTIKTIDRCPNGQAAYSGFPQAFDYYDTCAMGMCQTTGDPVDIELIPGDIWEVSNVLINTAGGTCSSAVPAGDYTLSFEYQKRGEDQPVDCNVPQATLHLQ